MLSLTMIRYFFFLGFLSVFHSSFAATVDTVAIFSSAMQQTKNCVVIVPDAKTENEKFPVVYLLHGYSGRYDNWIRRVPALKKYADEFQVMIVCPDGDYNSWYADSPVEAASKYETYISTEVPDFIDSHFPTADNRSCRAVTGLSMGGHGALFLAWRHANRFSAGGSMSGVMNLRPFAGRYELQQKFGDTLQHAGAIEKYSIINVVMQKPSDSLAIIFDCGVDDVFYPSNKALHQKLLQMNVAHDYTERPGSHNWGYWANAVVYQLLFFRRHFDRLQSRNTND